MFNMSMVTVFLLAFADLVYTNGKDLDKKSAYEAICQLDDLLMVMEDHFDKRIVIPDHLKEGITK